MPQNDLFSMEKYATGFVEACAQLGVDPVELVKVAQQLTPEQQQYGRAYRPGAQSGFSYGNELDQARDWELRKGDPARAGAFQRRALGAGLTSGLMNPLYRGAAKLTGSKPAQFVKGFFGGGDDRRAAPAPAPAVDPDYERYKREAQMQQGGGTIFDRMRRAEERYGYKYDSKLMGNMGKPWYHNVPQAPSAIRRPAPVESLVTPAGR